MKRGDFFIAVLIALIIFLSVTLFLGITNNNPSPSGNWSIALDNASAGLYQGMYVDERGTFYTVAGSNLYAIAGDGKTKWECPVGNNSSNSSTRYYLWGAQHVDGTLYVLIGPEPQYTYIVGTNPVRNILVAISDNGSLLWTAPTEGDYNMELTVAGERVYLYSDERKLSVFDLQGKLLRNINAYFPPVTGSDGMLYLINCSDPYKTNPLVPWSAALEAYFPNGSLYWSYNLASIGAPNVWMTYNPPGVHSLLYNEGMIYVPGYDALIAVDENGTRMWMRNCSYYSVVGFDDKGSIYLLNSDYANDSDTSMVIARDGKASAARLDNLTFSNNSLTGFKLTGFKNGIGYYGTAYQWHDHWSPADMGNYTIRAYDMNSGKLLWSYVIPPARFHTVTVNGSNVADILFSWDDLADTQRLNWIAPWVWYDSKGLPYGWHQNKSNILTNTIVSGSTVYFSYWAYSYDYPAFYDMSNCTYSGGLYALDNGKLLWYKDTDSYITSMTERNGTIYYFINGGRFSATGAVISAGFATAAIYLFFRFFMLGAVSRARARLNRNENRTSVLQNIVEHPGVTAADLSKNLTMNMGTIRYHLFILTLNHRVVTHQEDDKYLRYFTNSGTYTTTERSLLSLIRREPLHRTLRILAEKPGLTSQGLAKELNVSATAANRHLAMLANKGVIEQVSGTDRGHGYAIKDEHREPLEKAMSLVQLE